MGTVIKQFGQTYGSTDNAWIVPYPYWVDTRLPGVWAGIPNRTLPCGHRISIAHWMSGYRNCLLLNVNDSRGCQMLLKQLYPQGVLSVIFPPTKWQARDFMIFFVPPDEVTEDLL